MCSACRSGVADAPTVAVSALESARTPPRTTTTRVRAGPPKNADQSVRACSTDPRHDSWLPGGAGRRRRLRGGTRSSRRQSSPFIRRSMRQHGTHPPTTLMSDQGPDAGEAGAIPALTRNRDPRRPHAARGEPEHLPGAGRTSRRGREDWCNNRVGRTPDTNRAVRSPDVLCTRLHVLCTRLPGGCGRSDSRSRSAAPTTRCCSSSVLAVLGFVVTIRRTDAPWARAFKYYLILALLGRRDPRAVPVDLRRRNRHRRPRAVPPAALPPPHWCCRRASSADRCRSRRRCRRRPTGCGSARCSAASAPPTRWPTRSARCGCCRARCTSSASPSIVALSVAPQLVESVQRVRRARRLRAGRGRGCGRCAASRSRCSRTRSTGRCCWPRRWTRAATAAPGEHRHGEPPLTAALLLAGLVGLTAGVVRAARRDRAAAARPADAARRRRVVLRRARARRPPGRAHALPPRPVARCRSGSSRAAGSSPPSCSSSPASYDAAALNPSF